MMGAVPRNSGRTDWGKVAYDWRGNLDGKIVEQATMVTPVSTPSAVCEKFKILAEVFLGTPCAWLVERIHSG